MKPFKLHYSLVDVMMASTTEPLPADFRRHQLTRMWGGLRELETAASPKGDDWQVVSDAVDLMESLVSMGEVDDPEKTTFDAKAALAYAGARRFEGKPIRLDGKGIQSCRQVLENYAYCVDNLSARTMIAAHRLTQKRTMERLLNKKKHKRTGAVLVEAA